jgi:DnaJ homolog subfamily A member 2
MFFPFNNNNYNNNSNNNYDPHKLYETLEVSRDCDKKEIKKSFRRLAIIHHPDKNGDSETFQKINTAYEILYDDEKRDRYDRYGIIDGEQTQYSEFNNISELFSNLMNRRNMFDNINNMHENIKLFNNKPKMINVDVYLTLDEIYNGCIKEIFVQREVIVDNNNNTIKNDGKIFFTCVKCNGKGKFISSNSNSFIIIQKLIECNKCLGLGYVNIYPNEYRIKEKKCKFKYKFTKGVLNLSKIISQCIGHINPIDPYNDGDIEITVHYLEHDKFKLDNNYNILFNQSISIYESITGTNFIIDFFNNKKLLVENSNSIEFDSKKIIKNYGIPQLNKFTDFIITFSIIYPLEKLTLNEKKLFHDNFSEYYHYIDDDLRKNCTLIKFN